LNFLSQKLARKVLENEWMTFAKDEDAWDEWATDFSEEADVASDN